MSLPLQELSQFGQSVWLDYISRSLLDQGKLKSLIDQGLRGMTSNPSIFNQSISQSHDYDDKIIQLKNKGKSTFEIYDELTIKDIQDAADAFKNVYEKTQKLDGYVSLEINPLLANKVEEQATEGVRLFKKVNRPNLMIKVPSTNEGFPVIEKLIAQGINVNVTLIFSLKQYEKTVEAYLKGLNHLSKHQSDLSSVRSVASVFVSRVDTVIDKTLDEKIAQTSDSKQKENLKSLQGKAAVANCHIIYNRAEELFNSQAFKTLQTKRANIQRVLWGSTSTKNPNYPDVKYVTELIAPNTVNTIPENTLQAFIDHGKVKNAFTYDVNQSQDTLKSLKSLGIDITEVCTKLLDAGCVAFSEAFESLLKSIDKKAESLTAKS